MTGVSWCLTEVGRPEDGVLPDFYVAIVVKPLQDFETARALPFRGEVTLRTEVSLNDSVSRFLRGAQIVAAEFNASGAWDMYGGCFARGHRDHQEQLVRPSPPLPNGCDKHTRS